ncbi:MAG: ATP phosphoribosyltransferase regulatory subunit [Candidatus Niameybacter stercoravium]|nr:ATP phosphoribosyltransferase regulatory subunit [Candidatus Niameybacter stercoravium]
MKDLFVSYSYELIETPTFEYLDVFTAGDGTYQDVHLYKWLNRQGEIVALRSDMTKAIARVVASKKNHEAMPKRYAYVASSFRYSERYQGKVHEFTQAGIELVGVSVIEADIEVIQLGIEALKASGLEDFTIHMGSAKFLKALLEDIGIEGIQKEELYRTIEKKDAVKLEELLRKAKVELVLIEAVVTLIQSVGGMDLLETVRQMPLSLATLSALEELEFLYKWFEAKGLASYLLFDFSILSYASYYTGVMFQGYTQGIGEAILEGGRYDQLLSNFGVDMAAVGLGINVALLLQKLEMEGKLIEPARTLIVCTPFTRDIAYEIAGQFRKDGLIVEQSMLPTLEASIDYAERVGIQGLIYFKNNEDVDLYHLGERTIQTVKIASL